MRIAICDDEEMFRTQLSYLLTEYSELHKEMHISFSMFTQANDLLDKVNEQNGFDIYILDIVMPGMNGIELGIELRQNGYDGLIIYLTSSLEYAIESYKTKASNYILKPIIKNDFLQVLDEVARLAMDKAEKYIIIKTKENSVRLSIDNIMYAELYKRTILYHLINGDIIESVTIRGSFLDSVQVLLTTNHFFPCGKSMLVNLQHITSVGSEEIVFKNGQTLYFSKKICREIRSLWSDFWFNK